MATKWQASSWVSPSGFAATSLPQVVQRGGVPSSETGNELGRSHDAGPDACPSPAGPAGASSSMISSRQCATKSAADGDSVAPGGTRTRPP